jgi:hypothetical protein
MFHLLNLLWTFNLAAVVIVTQKFMIFSVEFIVLLLCYDTESAPGRMDTKLFPVVSYYVSIHFNRSLSSTIRRLLLNEVSPKCQAHLVRRTRMLWQQWSNPKVCLSLSFCDDFMVKIYQLLN